MYKNGWVKLYRKILEEEAVFKDGDYLSVYVYLLLSGSFSLYENQRDFIVEMSLGELSKRLKIEKTKIHRIIKHFKECNVIATKCATNQKRRRSLIVIKSLDFSEIENATSNEPYVQQLEEQREEKRKVAKEKSREKRIIKEKEKNNPLTPLKREDCTGTLEPESNLFEEFWSAYPKKIGKGYARRCFERLKVDKAMLEIMQAAIEKQKQSDMWKKEKGSFIPNPSTWLNQERWLDCLEDVDLKKEELKKYYDKEIYL